jgi:hypothetical protein
MPQISSQQPLPSNMRPRADAPKPTREKPNMFLYGRITPSADEILARVGELTGPKLEAEVQAAQDENVVQSYACLGAFVNAVQASGGDLSAVLPTSESGQNGIVKTDPTSYRSTNVEYALSSPGWAAAKVVLNCVTDSLGGKFQDGNTFADFLMDQLVGVIRQGKNQLPAAFQDLVNQAPEEVLDNYLTWYQNKTGLNGKTDPAMHALITLRDNLFPRAVVPEERVLSVAEERGNFPIERNLQKGPDKELGEEESSLDTTQVQSSAASLPGLEQAALENGTASHKVPKEKTVTEELSTQDEGPSFGETQVFEEAQDKGPSLDTTQEMPAVITGAPSGHQIKRPHTAQPPQKKSAGADMRRTKSFVERSLSKDFEADKPGPDQEPKGHVQESTSSPFQFAANSFSSVAPLTDLFKEELPDSSLLPSVHTLATSDGPVHFEFTTKARPAKEEFPIETFSLPPVQLGMAFQFRNQSEVPLSLDELASPVLPLLPWLTSPNLTSALPKDPLRKALSESQFKLAAFPPESTSQEQVDNEPPPPPPFEQPASPDDTLEEQPPNLSLGQSVSVPNMRKPVADTSRLSRSASMGAQTHVKPQDNAPPPPPFNPPAPPEEQPPDHSLERAATIQSIPPQKQDTEEPVRSASMSALSKDKSSLLRTDEPAELLAADLEPSVPAGKILGGAANRVAEAARTEPHPVEPPSFDQVFKELDTLFGAHQQPLNKLGKDLHPKAKTPLYQPDHWGYKETRINHTLRTLIAALQSGNQEAFELLTTMGDPLTNALTGFSTCSAPTRNRKKDVVANAATLLHQMSAFRASKETKVPDLAPINSSASLSTSATFSSFATQSTDSRASLKAEEFNEPPDDLDSGEWPLAELKLDNQAKSSPPASFLSRADSKDKKKLQDMLDERQAQKKAVWQQLNAEAKQKDKETTAKSKPATTPPAQTGDGTGPLDHYMAKHYGPIDQEGVSRGPEIGIPGKSKNEPISPLQSTASFTSDSEGEVPPTEPRLAWGSTSSAKTSLSDAQLHATSSQVDNNVDEQPSSAATLLPSTSSSQTKPEIDGSAKVKEDIPPKKVSEEEIQAFTKNLEEFGAPLVDEGELPDKAPSNDLERQIVQETLPSSAATLAASQYLRPGEVEQQDSASSLRTTSEVSIQEQGSSLDELRQALFTQLTTELGNLSDHEKEVVDQVFTPNLSFEQIKTLITNMRRLTRRLTAQEAAIKIQRAYRQHLARQKKDAATKQHAAFDAFMQAFSPPDQAEDQAVDVPSEPPTDTHQESSERDSKSLTKDKAILREREQQKVALGQAAKSLLKNDPTPASSSPPNPALSPPKNTSDPSKLVDEFARKHGYQGSVKAEDQSGSVMGIPDRTPPKLLPTDIKRPPSPPTQKPESAKEAWSG